VRRRHRLGSQAFVPLADARWLVVVAPGDAAPHMGRPAGLRRLRRSKASTTGPGPGTTPLIALDRAAEFLVVDRVADDGREDCEVVDSVDGNAVDRRRHVE
jgi:ureidoglycolate lyase